MRIRIDPDQVERVKVRSVNTPPADDPLELSDRKVIRQCVEEVNGLSYTPYGLWFGEDVGVEIVFERRDGRPIAQFAFGFGGRGLIMVRLPGVASFHIRYEPVPTIRALFRYRDFVRDREYLSSVAKVQRWDEETRHWVGYTVRHVNSLYPRASMVTPGSPEELAKAIQRILAIGLGNLPEFVRP
jgi:hypothetical protein